MSLRLKNELLRLIEEKEYTEKDRVNRDPWRLNYHLSPPVGWMSDPNGLCELNGIYHVFYQYSPLSPEGDLKFWGHYSSGDLIHWKKEDVALFPDTPPDKDGVYSGSAYTENGTAYFYYTGNVKHPGDYDYIREGREHNTVLVTSEDGNTFSEKKVLLTNRDYPPTMSCHVRDPMVWSKNGLYWMILGARTRTDEGRALLYSSRDKVRWTFQKIVAPEKELGYMWECPNVFELDGQQVLLFCPQGLKEDGIRFQNANQCGYYLVEGDLTTDRFALRNFRELDHGFDFYAPQTFSDSQGRRILIGWMGLPDADYQNPTVAQGWQHALTLPRELKIRNQKLCQTPVKELEQLRTRHKTARTDSEIRVGNSFELLVRFECEVDELKMEFRQDVCLCYRKESGQFDLELGKSGYGRIKRSVALPSLRQIQIFSDTSSLEIFLNDGEETFTTRLYDEVCREKVVISGKNVEGTVDYYQLSPFFCL